MMSDQLTVSAALSVLVMAIYVLFGADAGGVSLGAASYHAPVQFSAPSISEAVSLLPFAR